MRELRSRSQGNSGKSEREVGILGRRWVAPRWEEDIVRQVEILGWIWAASGCDNYLVWWLIWGLEYQGSQGRGT